MKLQQITEINIVVTIASTGGLVLTEVAVDGSSPLLISKLSVKPSRSKLSSSEPLLISSNKLTLSSVGRAPLLTDGYRQSHRNHNRRCRDF